jgi:metal-responsive CopG/Arc/MetJ family transcriptional regulator
MKTAISLPDDLFDAVERLVRRSRRHRSAVYADALREYVARHSPEEITDTLNSVIAEAATPEDRRFAAEAARRILKTVEP